MAEPLAGKSRALTGAARGIGRAIARKLAASGCDVAVNYYNSADEEAELCGEIRGLGRRACALQASVGIPDSVDEMFAGFRREFDRLDIVVSNAASGVLKPAEMTLKHWRWCMETNALALTSSGAGASISCRPAGASSRYRVSARRAMPELQFVGASKAALGPRPGARHGIGAARHSRQRGQCGVVDADALAYFATAKASRRLCAGARLRGCTPRTSP
jgi:enoyl-[acyl-carrier protein] reductase III